MTDLPAALMHQDRSSLRSPTLIQITLKERTLTDRFASSFVNRDQSDLTYRAS